MKSFFIADILGEDGTWEKNEEEYDEYKLQCEESGNHSIRTILENQKGDASSESTCLPSWRRKFTDRQTNDLEEIFLRQKYITGKERGEIAKKLGLTTKQVKTWFQNRRTKWKREKQRNVYQGEICPQDRLYSFTENCKGAMEDCVHCCELGKVIPVSNWGCYFVKSTYPVPAMSNDNRRL